MSGITLPMLTIGNLVRVKPDCQSPYADMTGVIEGFQDDENDTTVIVRVTSWGTCVSVWAGELQLRVSEHHDRTLSETHYKAASATEGG